MKYVVVTLPGGIRLPVIFPDQIAHAQVKIEGCDIVSAGFVTPLAKVHGKSESLKLGPAKGDNLLCGYLLSGAEALLNGQLDLFDIDPGELFKPRRKSEKSDDPPASISPRASSQAKAEMDCPRCKAKAGTGCVTPTGHRAKWNHIERGRVYLEKIGKEEWTRRHNRTSLTKQKS